MAPLASRAAFKIHLQIILKASQTLSQEKHYLLKLDFSNKSAFLLNEKKKKNYESLLILINRSIIITESDNEQITGFKNGQ